MAQPVFVHPCQYAPEDAQSFRRLGVGAVYRPNQFGLFHVGAVHAVQLYFPAYFVKL